MVDSAVRRYMARIGRKGGLRSRRRLSEDQARRMVLLREAGRAFREFHDRCFWSSPPDLRIQAADLPWVVEQLRRHGGRDGWERAQRLCR
jgi:hypothetical protein